MTSNLRSSLILGVGVLAAAAFALPAGVTVTTLTATPAFANASPQPAPRTVKKKTKAKKKKVKKRRKKRRQRRSEVDDPKNLQAAGTSQFPELKLANIQIQAGNYRSAITTLNALNRPKDANVLNLLGYSHRKLGLIDVGMRYYLAALENNPEHRGVHEYLGEAYLQKDDLGKAKVMLKKLGQICGRSCNEYKELAGAISEYQKNSSL